MKTYTKFLTKLFLKCFIKIVMIFFTVVLITSILEELQFFKQENIDFFLLTFLALLTTPSVLFEILPFIFLISTQFYFTKLIDANELEIFKFNGLDNLKILKIVSIISFLLGTLHFKIAAITSIVFQGVFLYRAANAQHIAIVITGLCFAFCAFLVTFLINLYA